jgi:hypothetical protein
MFTQSSHHPAPNAVPTLFKKLQKARWLKQLLVQTAVRQQLQAVFDQECPLEVMGRCCVLEMKEQCLVIGAENASDAMQLQYRTRELLPALRKHTALQEVKKIRVRILRDAPIAEKPLKKRVSPLLSPEAAQILRQTAARVTDPVLKEALLRFVGGEGETPEMQREPLGLPLCVAKSI